MQCKTSSAAGEFNHFQLKIASHVVTDLRRNRSQKVAVPTICLSGNPNTTVGCFQHFCVRCASDHPQTSCLPAGQARPTNTNASVKF